ncbi:hypothetical protein ACW5F0_06065 [Luteimonas sp. A534]
MNAGILFAIATISACAACVGVAHAQVRVSPGVADARQERVIEPGIRFDKAAALHALEPGNSTIQGTACWTGTRTGTRASNVPILLLPVTPYLEELVRLRKKARRGEAVLQSEELLKTSIATFANDKGRFQFTDLKPGRYYLYAVVDFTYARTHDAYRGTGQHSRGTVHYYSPETVNYVGGGEIEKFVDVKKDGDVVRTSLTNSGFYASLFKCVTT